MIQYMKSQRRIFGLPIFTINVIFNVFSKVTSCCRVKCRLRIPNAHPTRALLSVVVKVEVKFRGR